MLNTFKSILKLFDFMYHCNRLHRLMLRNGNALFLRTVTVVHFTDQNQISKSVYCIRFVMVCKIGFPNWNAKITILRASMVVTYYIKLFQMGADRRNGILMSLLLLVAKTKGVFILLKSVLRKLCCKTSTFLSQQIKPFFANDIL